MFWPCETRTSTCRNLATISSGLYRFLAIAVLLDVKDIPQVGPLQWGRIRLRFGYLIRATTSFFCALTPVPRVVKEGPRFHFLTPLQVGVLQPQNNSTSA